MRNTKRKFDEITNFEESEKLEELLHKIKCLKLSEENEATSKANESTQQGNEDTGENPNVLDIDAELLLGCLEDDGIFTDFYDYYEKHFLSNLEDYQELTTVNVLISVSRTVLFRVEKEAIAAALCGAFNRSKISPNIIFFEKLPKLACESWKKSLMSNADSLHLVIKFPSPSENTGTPDYAIQIDENLISETKNVKLGFISIIEEAYYTYYKECFQSEFEGITALVDTVLISHSLPTPKLEITGLIRALVDFLIEMKSTPTIQFHQDLSVKECIKWIEAFNDYSKNEKVQISSHFRNVFHNPQNFFARHDNAQTDFSSSTKKEESEELESQKYKF